MQAVRLSQVAPEKFALEEVAQPEPSAGQTIVRVHAAALNHRDVYITRGLYPNIRLPAILGADGCGEAGGAEVVIDPAIGWGPDERVWQPDATILGMPLD